MRSLMSVTCFLFLFCVTLALGGCSTPGPMPTQWLPSLKNPSQLEKAALHRIPVQGIADAQFVWIQSLDLDADGREDRLVTVNVPDELGPYWIARRAITYVFRGGEIGAFDSYARAEPWFFVVTCDSIDHVHYGDTETRRLFSLSRKQGEWVVTVNQYEYGNDGGEARDRLMTLQTSTTNSFVIKALSDEDLGFIGTFSAGD